MHVYLYDSLCCTTPNLSTINSHCVPLPDAGAPEMIIFGPARRGKKFETRSCKSEKTLPPPLKRNAPRLDAESACTPTHATSAVMSAKKYDIGSQQLSPRQSKEQGAPSPLA